MYSVNLNLRGQHMKRWKCPECDSGVLAPGKPRRNDVRRYCLDCSHAVGVLVERICPALEKDRVVARLKSAEKLKGKRSKAKADDAIRYHCEGHDLRKIYKVCQKLIDSNADHIRAPGLRSQRVSRVPLTLWRRGSYYSSGHCSGRAVHVTAGTNLPDAIFVLLHELCHVFAWRSEDGHRVHHGRSFRAAEHGAVKLWNDSQYRKRHDLPEASRATHR